MGALAPSDEGTTGIDPTTIGRSTNISMLYTGVFTTSLNEKIHVIINAMDNKIWFNFGTITQHVVRCH